MAKGRASSWRIWAAILAVAIIAIIVWRFWPPTPPDPLAGFTLMNLPRRDLDIGAVWTQDVGPTRGSGGILRLQTRSLQTSEVSTVSKIHASIFANIARSLHLGASGSSEAGQTLKLQGLTIVTVGDASKLSSVAGNQYIWEAVQADKFSIVSSQAAESEVREKIKNVAGADKIDAQVQGSGSVELTAEGSKLYIAYRVVTISQPTLSLVDNTETSNPSSDVNLGSEYAIHFSAARKGETIFTKNCSITMALNSFLVLDSKGNPTQSTAINIPCGGPYNQTYPIGSTTGSRRATIDSLQVKDLKVWPAEGDNGKAVGNFAIQRRTMQLETLNNPTAPGW
jgi:hypothetical protein